MKDNLGINDICSAFGSSTSCIIYLSF